MNAVAELDHVTKRYGERTALSQVSLEIQDGEILVLIGPNGAGKTTLVRILSGLLLPDEGRVQVLGHNPHRSAPALRQEIAVVPQQAGPDPSATPWEHVYDYLLARGVPSPAARQQAEEALRDLDLWDSRHRLTHTLSGGYQRRVLLAMALAASPRLLILDEPTTALDPAIRRHTWNVLATKRRGSILLTTHDMAEAEALADRVAVLAKGQLVAVATPGQLRDRLPAQERVHVDMDPQDPRAASLAEFGAVEPYGGKVVVYPGSPASTRHLVDALLNEGISFTVQSTTLEDVYLRLLTAPQPSVAPGRSAEARHAVS